MRSRSHPRMPRERECRRFLSAGLRSNRTMARLAPEQSNDIRLLRLRPSAASRWGSASAKCLASTSPPSAFQIGSAPPANRATRGGGLSNIASPSIGSRPARTRPAARDPVPDAVFKIQRQALQNVVGPVRFQTGSRDIQATQTKTQLPKMEIRSRNDDITLTVPEKGGFELDVNRKAVWAANRKSLFPRTAASCPSGRTERWGRLLTCGGLATRRSFCGPNGRSNHQRCGTRTRTAARGLDAAGNSRYDSPLRIQT